MIERLCHASAFTSPARIEAELAVDLPTWQARALPLGTDARHEDLLVENVQRLIATLHADARQRLQHHLDRAAEYRRKRRSIDGREAEEAGPRLEALRTQVMDAARTVRATVGLTRDGSGYDLKYLLALFNSSLLNFWYARQFPDVEVSIAELRRAHRRAPAGDRRAA
jgi:hypothetical protein